MEHHNTERQDRYRYLFYSTIVLCAFLATVALFAARNPAPPSGWQPQPDPATIDNSVHVNILSNNQLFSNNSVCIGSFDEC